MASVKKEANGRYKVRYRTPSGQSSAQRFDRKADAQRFAAAIEADKARGVFVDPRAGKTTLADFTAGWLASRLHVRDATRARDESLVRNHVISAFGDTALVHISKQDVQRWVASLSAAGYAPATIRKAYTLLGAIMAEAVDHRMIPESPCRRVSLPTTRTSERRFLSPAEVERLVESHPEEYRALIYTAAYLGPRWEELAGLRRENMNLLRRELRIVGTIERTAGTYRYTGETKSQASRRTLRLPAFLVEILAPHLEHHPGSEWVFPATQGSFVRYDNYQRRVLGPAVRSAGLEPLTFHELRHTAAALLVDQGADPLQVQRRLGDNDIKTTLGLYGHLFPNREDDLNDALERVFESATSSRVSNARSARETAPVAMLGNPS